MRNVTMLAAVAARTTFASNSMAGGLADEIMEAPVEAEDTMAPAGTSISPTFVILGILAALLIAAAVAEDDDDNDDTGDTTDTDVLTITEAECPHQTARQGAKRLVRYPSLQRAAATLPLPQPEALP